MIPTLLQNEILCAMPEHSRRVVRSRLSKQLDHAGGVSMGGFCSVIEAVCWERAVSDSERSGLRQQWEVLGRGLGGGMVWALTERFEVGISHVLTLLELWGQEADIGNLEQRMRDVVKAGANVQQLKALFGCKPSEFWAMKAEVGGSACRSKKPDEMQDAELYRVWESLGKPEDVEGMLLFSKRSGWALSVLYPLVQEWKQTEVMLRPKRCVGVEL